MSSEQQIYDVIGIGVGPFNLGLASLLSTIDDVDALFLEQKSTFDWHSGMLIEGTTLQVPFMADLVTMVDPTHPFSFLNYLKEHNRLYPFYFYEKFHIPRREYNHYCQWVSRQLNNCRFGWQVLSIGKKENIYNIQALNKESGQTFSFLAKNVVLGVGTQPAIPSPFQDHLGDDLFHTSSYLTQKHRCSYAQSITVVGSGQSAAEVFYDLLQDQASHQYSLTWLTRSKGFFPMEYSKLGLEHFTPDYIDYFYQLPQETKDRIVPNQDWLYKGISAETIADIYELLYERSAAGHSPKIELRPMTEVKNIEKTTNRYTLNCHQWQQDTSYELTSDMVIFGTGYQARLPDFLDNVTHEIMWDQQGRLKVSRDYRITAEDAANSGNIYVQNAELHTHGVGAPDLGLGAYRNAVIINHLTRRDTFHLEANHAFQMFTPTR
ncbi:lysine N(6)-hydroxylase/L-ornithine N(5)-oxygenase family protein [Tuberibacillus sp. Marseille-P3662]|uniref:lysine N(6)-hydroxylase/L-ornithine N(5)-oxygenase family protein n=1 Tax=Tuberibacillus sp. Marseille-P3662 TaxID=1965358 RepID=UPI000A1CE788|nr:lysine N(6)-hydroxylase/L-ornithine N(5)-oxygenase family protein [Tuberibacillus sp. Marseille-P3662]